MKTEAQIREKLLQVIDRFEHVRGTSALASASMIQALEWVLDVKNTYIDLDHPEELLKPSE